ncbi:hypothetical protein FGIG_11106 [Fasciola gigantica]|uniref:Leishmanolysin-like peptidase n=1 Tax=Fasciola gigantica TaxID=46835 RepID=A0A504YR13_FASGI|nr:hypothetical protein FGIG_11106 [Fasciola gigantica]
MPLVIPRTCKGGMSFIRENKTICQNACNEFVFCGRSRIPSDYLRACYVRRNEKLIQQYPDGTGRATDFFLHIGLGSEKLVDVAFASAKVCSFDAHRFRPILGRISIAPAMLNASASQINLYRNCMSHEIVHLLAFHQQLYTFYRYRNGTHRTSAASEVEPLRGKQPVANSNTLITQNTNHMEEFEVIGGMQSIITLPALVDVGRKYFHCKQLEGIPLENHPSNALIQAHFETRILAEELMAASPRFNLKLSNFTLVLLLETGWYDVSYASAQLMRWGKNWGCEFVNQSCQHYIEKRRALNQPVSPYCDPQQMDRPTCLWDRTGYGHCGHIKISTDKQITRSDPYEDNCPLAVAGKTQQSWDRISQNCKALIHGEFENLALESFGSESICLDHVQNDRWAYSSEGYSIPLSRYGASCHQSKCVNNGGLFVRFGSEWVLCPSNGGPVDINTYSNGGRLLGVIYCPPCITVCNETLCGAK